MRRLHFIIAGLAIMLSMAESTGAETPAGARERRPHPKVPVQTALPVAEVSGPAVPNVPAEGAPVDIDHVEVTTLVSQSASYQINWSVLSCGGGKATSASYNANGTVGQPAIGKANSANFQILHGYWQKTDTSCCIGLTGNVNKSIAETPDLSDLSLLIAYLTVLPRPVLPCTGEANVNASVATSPDLSDLSLLIAYLTVLPRPSLLSCP